MENLLEDSKQQQPICWVHLVKKVLFNTVSVWRLPQIQWGVGCHLPSSMIA